jgi:D-lactate dehydrogenase
MNLNVELLKFLPKERVKTRLIDLIAYANDAGFYSLTPKAVVQPIDSREIKALFNLSHQHNIPLTFRTGGTSLSGQSVTDGILVDLSQNWRTIKPENNGNQVRVQPGVIGATVNAYLKKFSKKIGPDPSSIGSAMMGGILSNNSSGMCCGVSLNSYHTTKFIKFILPNGESFDTENSNDYQRFALSEVGTGIENLRLKVIDNQNLISKIRHKYQTKNTVGYSLNAFLDYEKPLDVFSHLLIGAEGTLAFIEEAVLDTVPDYPYKATAFLYFPDIYLACKAIKPLKESGAEALELMDRASLRSIEHIKGVPEILKTLPESAAALLVEYQDITTENLAKKISEAERLMPILGLMNSAQFTQNTAEQYLYWKLRKGMFPSVGAVRAQGTTVILEDVAFPIETLADAVADLQVLFKEYKYENAIIFGHAKDGNIHFVVTQSFNQASEIARYEQFMEEVVELVVKKYDGALKAEHGTGRNMAPFVETEWGTEAYQIMKELKNLIDPKNLLNPGVIINEDKKVHVKNLKKLPVVEQEVDKCIECGACEPKCPSRDLTLTPRRRIQVRRELEIMKQNGKKEEYQSLLQDYQYDGLETCAVDGMCASDCPVDINTGDLVKRLRKENHSSFANNVALMVAKNFRTTEFLIKTALKSGELVNKVLGKNTMHKFTKGVKNVIPSFPLWTLQLVSAQRFSKFDSNEKCEVLYYPTCISRTMGGSKNGKKSVIETLFSVAQKSNIQIKIPENTGTCCGQAFSSKGYSSAFAFTANNTVAKLWEWSNEGKLPIITDVSSCTYTLQHCKGVLIEENKAKFDKMKILDSIDFLHDYVLPRTTPSSKNKHVVLHPVCSLTKMGLNDKFKKIASHFSQQVEVPIHAGCCGMAGDRGFLFPELTASATTKEANEVKSSSYSGYYSSAKTCEMSLSEAVGVNYESIIYLADECLI